MVKSARCKAAWVSLPLILAVPQFLSLMPPALADATPDSLTHVLEEEWNMGALRFLPLDCDGDGSQDVLLLGPPEVGTVADLQCRSIAEGSTKAKRIHNFLTGEVSDLHVADLDQDGYSEILIARMNGDSVWVQIHDRSTLHRLRSTESINTPDRDGTGEWVGSFKIHACADVDLDGVLDIITGIAAGHDKKPRGLWIFSGARGDVIRTFPTGGPPSKVHICSIDGAGGPLIIFSTAAPGNYLEESEPDDRNYYVYALNHRAEPLWKRKTADGESGTPGFAVADLDLDGRPEVILDQQLWEESPTPRHRLELRDAQNGKLIRYRNHLSKVHTILTDDLDRDGTPEVIAALADGTLRLLDGELNTLRSVTLGPWILPQWIGDADLDGEAEIAVRRGRSELLILNHRLTVIAVHEFPGVITATERAVTRGNAAYLLVGVAGYDGFSRVSVNKLARKTTGWRVVSGNGGSLGVFLGGLVGLGLGIGGVLVFQWCRAKWTQRRARQDAHADEVLLSSLAAFGHSGMARSNLERLAQYLEAPPDPDDPRRAEYDQRLLSIAHTYNDFTRGQLQQVADLLEGDSRWQRPAERLRSLIADLNRLISSQRPILMARNATPEEIANAGKRVRDVIREVKTLRRRILGTFRTEVPAIVSSVLASGREKLDAHGVTEVTTTVRGIGLARVEQRCLQTCLEILIDNAAEAMESSKSRKLQIAIEDQQGIVLKVSDTGCGIPHDDWERVFERGVTTKGQGRGLGLYHVRQALGSFDGSVRVHSSSGEDGTVMVMTLPGVEHSETRATDEGAAEVART